MINMNENRVILNLIEELRKDLDYIELDIAEPNPKKAPYQKAWSIAVEMDRDLSKLLKKLLYLYRKEAKSRRELRKHEA